MNAETRYGNMAEGNDFHRREQDLEIIKARAKADKKHNANMRAWRWLHREAIRLGNLDVANNIMQSKLIPNVA